MTISFQPSSESKTNNMQKSKLKNISSQLRILYPLWMIVGMFSLLYIPSRILVKGDAVATTQNIFNQELLFRVGIAGSLLTQLLYVIIPLLLYYLFKDFDKHLSLLMVGLSWISIPITMYNEIYKIEALTVLDSSSEVMHLLEMNAAGINIASIFWGLWLFPLGRLCIKSRYFPKFIGYALYLGGVGYFFGSFMNIIFPEAETLYSILEFLTFGEVVFILWLVIKGSKFS